MTNLHHLPSKNTQLVPVYQGTIGDSVVQVVDARELHAFLENGDHFAGWIKARIEKYDFIEDQDFAIFSEITEKLGRGRPTKEYRLTLDMAKELSMVENNAKGREARRYFIAMERRALQVTQAPVIHDPVLNSLVILATKLDALKTAMAAHDERLRRYGETTKSVAKHLNQRLEKVEIQHRNGVPQGYLSKKQAFHLHGAGLSERVFHEAMTRLGVPTVPYLHLADDGHEVPTHAYEAGSVAPAVKQVLDTAVQIAPKTCSSPLLNGRSFRYVKSASINA